MLGASIVEADLLADLRGAFHVDAADRALVELIPLSGLGRAGNVGHSLMIRAMKTMSVPGTLVYDTFLHDRG
jgi:hypothetical protein